MADHDGVVAVVVAYNRRELLLEAVDAIFAQTVVPDAVVVVDNASDDGSAEAVAARHPSAEVVRLERNTGGAGGFTVGLAVAMARPDARWVWLMDDDTVPNPTALERLLDGVAGRADVAVVGSRVVWTDGRDHPMNTPRPKPFAGARRAAARPMGAGRADPVGVVRVDLVAPSGCASAGCRSPTTSCGTTTSSTPTRLVRGGSGSTCRRASSCTRRRRSGRHRRRPGRPVLLRGPQQGLAVHPFAGLNPGEKALYIGSTLRRWMRTCRQVTRAPWSRSAGGFAAGLARAGSARTEGQRGVSARRAAVGAGARGDPGDGPFRLLMPVYARRRAAYFARAVASATTEQTRPPDEVVLVRTGRCRLGWRPCSRLDGRDRAGAHPVELAEQPGARAGARRRDAGVPARDRRPDGRRRHRRARPVRDAGAARRAGADLVGIGAGRVREDDDSRRPPHPPVEPDEISGTRGSTTRSTIRRSSIAGAPSCGRAATAPSGSWRTTGCSRG